jgi:hypothetical protein
MEQGLFDPSGIGKAFRQLYFVPAHVADGSLNFHSGGKESGDGTSSSSPNSTKLHVLHFYFGIALPQALQQAIHFLRWFPIHQTVPLILPLFFFLRSKDILFVLRKKAPGGFS